MERILTRLTLSFAAALFLLVAGSANSAQAQTITFNGVPCVDNGAGVDCQGTNNDGVYVDYHLNVNDPNFTTLYVFDYTTGRSTNLRYYEDANGNLYMWGYDSELGSIDFNSGWLSVFYPTGNPFSAAVHNPNDYLMANYTPLDPWGYDGGGGTRPQPLRP